MTNHDEEKPDTEETDPAKADIGTSDVESDPALDNGESTDWSSEGGATPAGPATDPDD